MQLDRYNIVYTRDMLYIGCESHPIEDWFSFDDEKVAQMDDRALEWWEKWKDIILQIIEISPAK
jgi:hypothetical protein